MDYLRLSPSSLNLFLECPLCFWLEQTRGIHRPRGIFPSLPGGMDLLIKKYFDKYRELKKLPPEIGGKVEGKLLENQNLIEKWRSWRKGLQYFDKNLKAVLVGALDECLIKEINGQLFYIPLDYKTRGFDLKEDPRVYYQNQLNCYTLLLETNGFKHLSFAYLLYYIPYKVAENGLVYFKVEPIKIETNPKDALEIFQKAVNLIRGPKPESHSECSFCAWEDSKKTEIS